MVEILEAASGYVVRCERYRDTFQCKANALLAARILATAEAVLGDHDVGVLVPMGNGEVVCMNVLAHP